MPVQFRSPLFCPIGLTVVMLGSQPRDVGFNSLIGYYMVDMAKLADAVDCGSTVRNHVRVQVPLFTLITAVIRAVQKQAFQACQTGSAPIPSIIGLGESGVVFNDVPLRIPRQPMFIYEVIKVNYPSHKCNGLASTL